MYIYKHTVYILFPLVAVYSIGSAPGIRFIQVYVTDFVALKHCRSLEPREMQHNFFLCRVQGWQEPKPM